MTLSNIYPNTKPTIYGELTSNMVNRNIYDMLFINVVMNGSNQQEFGLNKSRSRLHVKMDSQTTYDGQSISDIKKKIGQSIRCSLNNYVEVFWWGGLINLYSYMLLSINRQSQYIFYVGEYQLLPLTYSQNLVTIYITR